MARKNQSEEERQKEAREARKQGKSPSEAGATVGAQKQIAHDKDPSHPKQKTTHPVRD